jgi:WD40 repeat protein
VSSAAFSPDGKRIVTASFDNTARIWDAATAKEIEVLRGHAVDSAAFSPDGKRIVTASFDNTARIWDAATAKEIAVLHGHGDRVYSAAFSPDGSRIVTASWDKTARIWDAHLQSMSSKDLLAEACARLAGLSKLTRDEMRLAGYPDSMPEIDVCP